MLKEAAVKLAAFRASEKNGTPKVVPIKKRSSKETRTERR